MIRPLRRITRHFAQIFFTLGLTFIGDSELITSLVAGPDGP
ncbi:hypothetical protein HNR10_002304 [Nocardiopsis aegyptia]|uniref:Uncharacterized protein n=1 Tax=Nocardiopsis aegyptia TaxID=220378 RepID=A0A7Z0ENB8_9ACTN|nr:hypothetical protein [Nocardiopsis aegyptia]